LRRRSRRFLLQAAAQRRGNDLRTVFWRDALRGLPNHCSQDGTDIRPWSPARDVFKKVLARQVIPGNAHVGRSLFDRRFALRTGAVVAGCLIVLTVGPSCGSNRARSKPTRGKDIGSSLTLSHAPVRRLRVPHYVTSGFYPRVVGPERAVNAALRRAILADQHAYAPRARRAAKAAANGNNGIYSVSVDRGLVSASSTVVSALLPSTKLYPGGNEGTTWIGVTVRVPSGRVVQVSDLFAAPGRGLQALANAWKDRIRRSQPRAWPCVRNWLADYRPTPDNYRLFGLTPNGLAVGFWAEPACPALKAILPYHVLRPYLSALGRRLVDGVRAPRFS
jgi:hypothetical protein